MAPASGSTPASAAAERVRIVLREGAEITRDHRLVDRGRTFRILSMRERDRGRFIEIEAERVAR